MNNRAWNLAIQPNGIKIHATLDLNCVCTWVRMPDDENDCQSKKQQQGKEESRILVDSLGKQIM